MATKTTFLQNVSWPSDVDIVVQRHLKWPDERREKKANEHSQEPDRIPGHSYLHKTMFGQTIRPTQRSLCPDV